MHDQDSWPWTFDGIVIGDKTLEDRVALFIFNVPGMNRRANRPAQAKVKRVRIRFFMRLINKPKPKKMPATRLQLGQPSRSGFIFAASRTGAWI